MKNFLNWIELKLSILWYKAEKSAKNNSDSLSKLRIFYGIFILLFLNLSFSWIGEIPQGLFLPNFLSLSIFFNGFPHYNFMLGIEIILVCLGFCLLLGIKARWTGIAFIIVYIIGNSFSFSFGKINHGSVMFITFILGLSFTNWGVNNALVPDKRVSEKFEQRVLATLGVILCFGMFTAGLEKALYWVDFDLNTGGFLSWFYQGYFTQGRERFLAPLILQLPPQMFEVADYLAVVFELSPLLALLSGRKWWLLWLLVACTFHLANTLLLNINFIAHAPVYLTFVSLSWGKSKHKSKFGILTKFNYLTFAISIAAFIALHYLLNLLVRESSNFHLMDEIYYFANNSGFPLYLNIVIWLITMSIIAVNLLIPNKTKLNTDRI
ncbi:hypothetical protein I4641_13355 [Waterburya agarophytonicola K14]|uniref:HTTM domain-containing protein n=1 Tax=Waterburya agarophytonicola KI4 TaxID=2874699 RepID=A0A964BU85_9CYAN|nr:hypothetical protein [Waterburya agarophytonicola]MCC0177965.1 hypothetical protein [Waterburya agarophytonicola KI4]